MSEGIGSMQEAVEKIQSCNNQRSFDAMKFQLQDYMKRTGIRAEGLLELEKRDKRLPSCMILLSKPSSDIDSIKRTSGGHLL